MQGRVVRMAELEIDPVQLEAYKAALKEEIETSIRSEPGVLTLYAVSLKENPAHIRIFETYADMAAYKTHTSKLLISKSTRTSRKKWLSPSNLLRLTRLCSGRRVK